MVLVKGGSRRSHVNQLNYEHGPLVMYLCLTFLGTIVIGQAALLICDLHGKDEKQLKK